MSLTRSSRPARRRRCCCCCSGASAAVTDDRCSRIDPRCRAPFCRNQAWFQRRRRPAACTPSLVITFARLLSHRHGFCASSAACCLSRAHHSHLRASPPSLHAFCRPLQRQAELMHDCYSTPLPPVQKSRLMCVCVCVFRMHRYLRFFLVILKASHLLLSLAFRMSQVAPASGHHCALSDLVNRELRVT